MPKAILPYSAEKILEIRSWVKDCETWREAKEIIVEKLGIHPDNARRMQNKHGFWQPNPSELKPVEKFRPLRRLFLDLETSPNVVLSWRVGYKIKLDPSNILKERAIICACWKWEGEEKIYSITWDRDQEDKVVVKKLMEIMAEADEVVGQNGDKFDIPWFRTRCLFHGFSPLPNYKTIDTLKIARSKFYFNSNRLDYIAKFLGLGGKIKTEFNLWKDVVLDKCPEALAKMVEYCGHDVALLEQVYNRLMLTTKPKTHAGVMNGGDKWYCPHCGSNNIAFVKTRVSAAGTMAYDMKCEDCGASFTVNETVFEQWQLYQSVKI